MTPTNLVPKLEFGNKIGGCHLVREKPRFIRGS